MRDDAPTAAAAGKQHVDDDSMVTPAAGANLPIMVPPAPPPVSPAPGTIAASPQTEGSEWQGRPVAPTAPQYDGGSIQPPGDGARLQSPGDDAQSPPAFEGMDIRRPADRTGSSSPAMGETTSATSVRPAAAEPPANVAALTPRSGNLRSGSRTSAPVADTASTARAATLGFRLDPAPALAPVSAPVSALAGPTYDHVNGQFDPAATSTLSTPPPSRSSAPLLASAEQPASALAVAAPPNEQLAAQPPDVEVADAQVVDAEALDASTPAATTSALPVITPASTRADAPAAHATSAYAISTYARAEPPAQVASFVASLASTGNSAQRLTLRLDPIELGHIEVTIDRRHGMPATITLSVERPETLLRLVRDQEQLLRALDLAGLAAGDRDLRFQLATRDTSRAGDTDAPRPDIQQAQGQGPNQNQANDTANASLSQRQDGSPDPRPQNQGGQHQQAGQRSHAARQAAAEIAAPADELSSRTQQLSGVDITA